MEEAVRRFIADAMGKFHAADPASSAKAIRGLLADWKRFDKLVHTTLPGILEICTNACDHNGAQTGYNERDGSWMNPCPKCGHSY